MLFTYLIGYFAKSIEVELQPVYYYYYNPNSLTNEKNNIKKELISLQHLYQTNEFRKFIGHEEWASSLFKRFLRLIKKNGLLYTMKVYWEFNKKKKDIISNKRMFVNIILSQKNNK